MKILTFLTTLFFSVSTLQSQTLIKDINPSQDTIGSAPSSFIKLNDKLIFVANVPQFGSELWVIGENDEEPILLKDIYPGNSSSIGINVYSFSTNGSSFSRNSTILGDYLYFMADDGGLGNELWKTDGTENGTQKITNFLYKYEIRDLATVNNKLIFVTVDNAKYGDERISFDPKNEQLWISDGTKEGTIPFFAFDSQNHIEQQDLYSDDNGLYFVPDGSLWYSDGTEEGTNRLVSPISGAGMYSGTSDLSHFIKHDDGNTYFVARTIFDGSGGWAAIWKSDGTSEGTFPVFRFYETDSGQFVRNGFSTKTSTGLFFSFYVEGLNRFILLKTDGTSEGTSVAIDESFDDSFSTAPLVSTQDYLYFIKPNTPSTVGLFQLNLVSGQILNVGTFDSYSKPSAFRSTTNNLLIKDKLVFISHREEDGSNKLYSYNEQTNTFLKLTFSGTVNNQIAMLGNDFYFTGNNDINGFELWKTNSSLEEFQIVEDLNTNADAFSKIDDSIFVVNDRVIFSAYDPIDKYQIWSSDGSSDNTLKLTEVAQGTASDLVPFSFKFAEQLNQNLLFPYRKIETGAELWKSDGTVANTAILKDIKEGTQSSITITEFKRGLGKLYFIARDDISRRHLWETDGSVSGTIRIFNSVDEYQGSRQVSDFGVVGDSLYFVVSSNPDDLWVLNTVTKEYTLVTSLSHGREFTDVAGSCFFLGKANFSDKYSVWKSDGTSQGTYSIYDNSSVDLQSISNLFYFKDELYFTAYSQNTGREIWKTDGTSEGTILLKDIVEGKASSINEPQFTIVDGVLFFVAFHPASGIELWRTNGTSEGTVLAADIHIGTASSNPNNLQEISGSLYFSAYTSDYGVELWKYQSNEALLAADIFPGAGNGNPNNIRKFSDDVVFIGDDGIHGYELFKLSQNVLSINEEKGIDDLEDVKQNSEEVIVYPNPTLNKLWIRLTNDILKNNDINMSIYNSAGQLLQGYHSVQIINSKIELNTNNLSSGIYIIEIHLNGKIFTNKFIKI